MCSATCWIARFRRLAKKICAGLNGTIGIANAIEN